MANQDEAGTEHDEDPFNELPKNLRAMVEAIGFPEMEGMEDDEKHVYDLVKQGKCMTCSNTLAHDANFIVNRYGIVGGYCSGVCHSDMAVLGFLQESHQDLIDRINFRDGSADTVDGTAEEEHE